MTNLKTLVSTMLTLTQCIISLLQNHRDALTWITLLPKLATLSQLLTLDYDQLCTEYVNLSDSDRQELYEYISAEFDLENDLLETAIETSFKLLLNLQSLIKLA